MEYLVKWKNRGIKDDLWFFEQELAHIQGSSTSEAGSTSARSSCFSCQGCLIKEHPWVREIGITQKEFLFDLEFWRRNKWQ